MKLNSHITSYILIIFSYNITHIAGFSVGSFVYYAIFSINNNRQKNSIVLPLFYRPPNGVFKLSGVRFSGKTSNGAPTAGNLILHWENI